MFASKVVDKPYDQLKWRDQVKVAKQVGLDLFVNTFAVMPDVVLNHWKKEDAGEKDGYPVIKETFSTPAGDLVQVNQMISNQMPWTIEYALKSKADFGAFEYLLYMATESGEAYDTITDAAENVGDDGVVMTWVGVPMELVGFMDRANVMMLAIEDAGEFGKIAEKLHASQRKMAISALEKGADVITVGMAGTELTSPDIFRQFATPYAKDMADICREKSKYSYVHMCGRIKALLDQIRDIHPTIFETFSPPPEGEIEDIGAARDVIGRDIVAKGNINLTFLAEATPDEVYQKGKEIIEEAGAERFILSVADVLLANHSVENVEALVRAGHDHKF